MESVLPCRLDVDIRLLHVLCLVFLYELVSLSFCGDHLVAVVPN